MSTPGPWVWLIVGLVAVQRLAEMFHARRNTLCLLAEGGVESGAGHYPLIVGLHVAWLASMLIHVASDTPVHWPFLFAYLILQGFRAWVLVSLGRGRRPWVRRYFDLFPVKGQSSLTGGRFRI